MYYFLATFIILLSLKIITILKELIVLYEIYKFIKKCDDICQLQSKKYELTNIDSLVTKNLKYILCNIIESKIKYIQKTYDPCYPW